MKKLKSELCSLYYWNSNDKKHEVYRYADASIVILRAFNLINGPGAKEGIVKTVQITNSLDVLVFEWKNGIGITFPPDPRSK